VSAEVITVELVRSTASDDALFELLGAELGRRLPNGRSASDSFVHELRALPVGLRAMAATYELDVSLTLDDLGYHFGNWHHQGLAEETLAGLRELGADRLAEIFSAAFQLANPHWDELGTPGWSDWYNASDLEQELELLNREAWSIQKAPGRGIFAHWTRYARAHPENLI
jgi:hypothetical protein